MEFDEIFKDIMEFKKPEPILTEEEVKKISTEVALVNFIEKKDYQNANELLFQKKEDFNNE